MDMRHVHWSFSKKIKNGRLGTPRTCDHTLNRRALYQTELLAFNIREKDRLAGFERYFQLFFIETFVKLRWCPMGVIDK